MQRARPRTATVRVPTASSSARSCETSRIAPGNARRASSSASRLSMSRWLVGSSRISTFGGWAPPTSTASDSRRRSPPDSPASGFSASSPENRKRPSSARALFGVRPVARWAASTHALLGRARQPRAPPRAGRGSRPSRCGPSLRACRPAARGVPARISISVVLPAAVGPHQRDVLAAFEPQLGVLEQRHGAAAPAPAPPRRGRRAARRSPARSAAGVENANSSPRAVARGRARGAPSWRAA